MLEAWIRIGTVRSVNPARREARIAPLPGQAHEFSGRAWLRVQRDGQAPLRCKVDGLRTGPGGLVIASFAAGVPRDTVGTMRGAVLVLAPEETTFPDNGDLRAGNLPGLAVRAADGTALGTVVEAYDSPAHPVVCVARKDGRRFLLPLTEAVLAGVDYAAGKLVVDGIEGHVVEETAEEG